MIGEYEDNSSRNSKAVYQRLYSLKERRDKEKEEINKILENSAEKKRR